MAGEIETREFTNDMSMGDFVQWMNVNFGTMGAADALQQAAFMLCCDVISQDIAKASLRLRERLPNNTSRVVMAGKHQIATLLADEPNRRHTWYEFSEMMLLWHCLTQNALAGVIRNNLDEPQELIPFQTPRVMEKVEGRDIFYDCMASTMQEMALLGAPMKTFHERDMIHVRGRLFDGMDGYSTLIAGRTTLETGDAIEDYRKSLFSEEGQMRGVFRRKAPGAMSEVAFQRLKQQLKVLMVRFKRDPGTPIVLEDDIEFQPIASKPQELELTKQLQEQIVATARLLRVPPHKIFFMEGVKYENLETMEKAYVGDTLVPIARQFELRFAKVLLSKDDRIRYFFEYDREEMTLRDTKAETERVKSLVERGVIEIDEARARMGYNPLPNNQGQVRLIPVNMTVVDRDGNIALTPSANQKTDVPVEEPPPAEPKKMAPALRVV